MASSPLTLAALATSAVPGLIVHGTRDHVGEGTGDYTSAVLVCEEEDLIVRVPRTAAAEVRQSAELLALTALTAGARARLPFHISEPRGVTRAGDTRAVVSTFLPGAHIEGETLDPDAILIDSIAEMLAAIHELPHTIAHQHGLTVRSAEEVRLDVTRLVDRAVATRLVPDTVQSRWYDALRNTELWDFAPALVHGTFALDQLLVRDDEIMGVLGWSELSVGDPAADLTWLLGSGQRVLDEVLIRYTAHRGLGGHQHLRERTVFLHELEVAKWLLHGVDQHDQATIDDAVAMLDQLVERGGRSVAATQGASPLDTGQVAQLLDEVPEVSAGLSDTAAYEALDEDRMFHIDTDFIDPPPEGDTPTQDEKESAEEQITEPLDDRLQETEPIDPDLLPPQPSQ